MEAFKEFQGDDLDSAIETACDYFNSVREKLEIEILQDSKSGIFGIVGARKAKIRARRVQLRETVENILGKTKKTSKIQKSESSENKTKKAKASKKINKNELPLESEMIDSVLIDMDADAVQDDFASEFPQVGLENMDLDTLKAVTTEVVREIATPIAGEELALALQMDSGRIRVNMESKDDPGLLIGREGQTLAALQYMVSRIVSRKMQALVRVQLDAGSYKKRQEDKLREMALNMAERVKRSGRSFSTRPMSSYHRRIIHVCLQNDNNIQTHSIGDGPLKKVIISRKK